VFVPLLGTSLGTVSPCLPDNCLKEFCICPQFAMLGVSQITNQSQTVTEASRSFEASWSMPVQKILNFKFKIFRSDDNKQWVNQGDLSSKKLGWSKMSTLGRLKPFIFRWIVSCIKKVFPYHNETPLCN
jgi:hypothetical protein